MKLRFLPLARTLHNVELWILTVHGDVVVEHALILYAIIVDDIVLVVGTDQSEVVGVAVLVGAGYLVAIVLGVELGIVLVAVAAHIYEAEHFLVVFGVCRLDEVGTCIYDLLGLWTPVVAARLVEQVDVFLAGVHLAPSHATDVGIHTADSIEIGRAHV